jgi:NADH-quinone oxidoreductase subunit J
MSTVGADVAFWICGGLAVLGAIGLVTSRKAVHSALFMALTMINLAFLYAVNQAPFLALVQVIVYTGAVMMLFLFVLMIIGVDASDSLVETIKAQRGWSVLFGGALAALLVSALVAGLDGVTAAGLDEANAAQGGNVQGLAFLLFDRYLLAFQTVAALLITAALGALVLAHREHLEPKKSQADLARGRILAGEHPGVLPNPGVISSTNAIGNPALLPDGSPALASIPVPLRGYAPLPGDEPAAAGPTGGELDEAATAALSGPDAGRAADGRDEAGEV